MNQQPNTFVEPHRQGTPALGIPPQVSAPVPNKVEGRHDGWSGEKIAKFCETLAETAIVAEACDQAGMGISGAYALRRRSPLFAAAWDAALTIARERLADTLLARSIEGNIEQIWRDGELVGERHVIDNRLGLAILRRLDRLAETGSTVTLRGEQPRASARPEHGRGAPAPRSESFDWEMMVDALRTGDPDAVAAALAMAQGNKVEEVEGPPVSLGQGNSEPGETDLSDRCWQDEEGVWLTDFAPPPGFDGYQEHSFGSYGYERECTVEEAELLEAREAAAELAALADEEALRDSWFAALRAELAEPPSAGEQSRSDCEAAS